MKNKVLTIGLGIVVVSLIGLSAYLAVSLRDTQAELQGAVESLEVLLARSEILESDLTTAHAEIGSLQTEIVSLEGEAAQIEAEKQGVETQAQLYMSQKYYLADVLAWFGRNYGLVDVEHMVRSYQVSTGLGLPETCEVSAFDRYVRWAATNSQMFVVTPDKMGWTTYTNWSVRENVVFGAEHLPEENGYVGSRGFEFRYPLVVGGSPQAEVHTTINVFDYVVDRPIAGEGDTPVELKCGVMAYFTPNPTDNSSIIKFIVGDFDINIKLKYFSDYDQALVLLTQAANIVVDELTSGW
jgi:hypothetical protein